MATFPGKGSGDVVEQTEGKMQTGCCLLWLHVKFEQNHIFKCISVRAKQELMHLYWKQNSQCHIEVTQYLSSLHLNFLFLGDVDTWMVRHWGW